VDALARFLGSRAYHLPGRSCAFDPAFQRVYFQANLCVSIEHEL
jgi:hypothetical protein